MISAAFSGSPPRVRGKVRRYCRERQMTGITPARAGKSSVVYAAAVRIRDHPRACGEKYLKELCTRLQAGSPPRVRGKVRARTDHVPGKGITPARAGKSEPIMTVDASNRDHPRACGEKSLQLSARGMHWGSPPRVRGKGFCLFHARFDRGITPARAGKSRFASSFCDMPRDHPRACGEKPGNLWGQVCPQGSPPRVRGKVTNKFGYPSFKGITPARAGKSQRHDRFTKVE